MDELPTIYCEGCGARYTVIWNRSIETEDGVHFCPFCGDEDHFTPDDSVD